ncbi:protein rhomboid isoform X2 [Diabrotica undecimpunctata]|uniref:protein rhomboid isoform X2 n=1 Tax=Diabrotica undecimpunctata TaxID=50387 RepID=UPI003B63FF48
MSVTSKNNYELSPATTPGSSIDEEKCLVPYQISPQFRKKWIRWENTPFGILAISFIQLLIHIFATASLRKALRFEPDKRIELWRFFTYMLIHDGWYHFMLNIVIQCIFAVLLEKRQGHLRVLILYFLGGFTGVLGASCVHPDLVIGASAGVYALLISNIPDIILIDRIFIRIKNLTNRLDQNCHELSTTDSAVRVCCALRTVTVLILTNCSFSIS